MQIPVLLLALGSVVAGHWPNVQCYNEGESGGPGDFVRAAYSACEMFSNRTYDPGYGGQACITFPPRDPKAKSNWLFDRKNVSPELDRTQDILDCFAGFAKPWFRCKYHRGGVSQTPDWRFRVDPNHGPCPFIDYQPYRGTPI
ncbi:hypothetical protein F5Y18DRAFT_424712 [Xylariaceae sp. FL1019]|nr:hypothetical protein F5Y18DRAFT_424712 [Xylariaceae sp. FL1019]